MACFLVSAAEAIVVAGVSKVVEKNEKKPAELNVTLGDNEIQKVHVTPFSTKLKWLSRLQLGGSALLAFEHVWHGEIVPYFPFLTAMGDPSEATVMFDEMATVGVGMAIVTTLAWAGMVAVSTAVEKKAMKESAALAKK